MKRSAWVRLAAMCLAAAACGETERETEETIEAEPQRIVTLPPPLDVIALSGPVKSLAFWRHPNLPFESRIVVAQGDAGVTLYGFDGKMRDRVDAPADLLIVGDTLIAAGRRGATRLYAIDGDGVTLEPMAESKGMTFERASEIVANQEGGQQNAQPFADPSTLLRFELSADRTFTRLSADGEIAAIARLEEAATAFAFSTRNFGGVYRNGVLAFAGDDGTIGLRPLPRVAEAMGFPLGPREGPTRGERLVTEDQSRPENQESPALMKNTQFDWDDGEEGPDAERGLEQRENGDGEGGRP